MTGLPKHLQATFDTLQAHASDGTCQMSQAELALARDLARQTISRHLRELERLGHVSIHRRPGQPSVYQLTNDRRSKRRRIIDALRQFMPWGQRSGERSASASASQPSDPPTQSVELVGREDILSTLQENVAKGQHTLLVGPLGIGKSHLLHHFATTLEQGSTEAREQGSWGAEGPGSTGESSPSPQHPGTPAPQHIYLEHVSPIKPALLGLAEQLHADGVLEVEGIEATYLAWDDVRKKLTPLRVNQLAELVIGCMKHQDYVLVLDHLERVTPTMLPHLNALLDVAVIVAAADELKSSAQRLWWSFDRIEVPPLTNQQARDLLWQVADPDRIAEPQFFETRVLQQAGGNPLAILTMAAKSHMSDLSAREIRGLHHGAGIDYVPLTPLLMIIGALIVAARFVALGLNDRDLYVLAGLGYAFFFVMRYFIYRVD